MVIGSRFLSQPPHLSSLQLGVSGLSGSYIGHLFDQVVEAHLVQQLENVGLREGWSEGL